MTDTCTLCQQYEVYSDHDFHKTLHFVGWGGKSMAVPAVWDLGITAFPLDGARRGIRRAVFDIAYGYVNGFPPSAVAWYVLTRSLPPHWLYRRISQWEISRWETRRDG